MPVTCAAAALTFALVLWLGLFALREARAPDSFDLVRWELETVANKALFAIGSPVRADLPAEVALRRYFTIEDRYGAEALRLENIVESVVEGRVDAAIREAGVTGRIGLAVWPPVDIELALSPRVLVTSPRAEIRRLGDRLLRAGLSPAERDAIEGEAAARDTAMSVLAVPTGGVATYPAIVRASKSYQALVATAAHEWVHHYLAFYPLGAAVYADPDGLTINETVASIAGDELGAMVVARHGDPAPPAPGGAAPGVDRDEVLRDLHVEVDDLLSQGRIEEAERRMEEVRRSLGESGVYIRRINQAYFAFYGTYASRDDAIHPLGGQLIEIRERAGSLARFLELVRGLSSAADVEALLAELRAGSGV